MTGWAEVEIDCIWVVLVDVWGVVDKNELVVVVEPDVIVLEQEGRDDVTRLYA